MSSRNSVHDFIMLLPALLLVGWLVLVALLQIVGGDKLIIPFC